MSEGFFGSTIMTALGAAVIWFVVGFVIGNYDWWASVPGWVQRLTYVLLFVFWIAAWYQIDND